jgi:hypothetical protein
VLVLVLAWHRMARRRHLSATLLFRVLRQQEKLPLPPPEGPLRRSKSRVSGTHLNPKIIKNFLISLLVDVRFVPHSTQNCGLSIFFPARPVCCYYVLFFAL